MPALVGTPQIVSVDGSASHDITLSVVPTSGNALVFIGQTFSSATFGAITDNNAGVYAVDHSFLATGGDNGIAVSRRNITDAPTTMTIPLSASTSIRGFILEISGMPDTGHVGQTGDLASQGGFTTEPSISFTPATANEFALAFLSVSTTRYAVQVAGYTLQYEAGPPANRMLLYNADVGVAEAKTVSAQLTAADLVTLSGTNAHMSVLTYVAAGGGSPTYKRHLAGFGGLAGPNGGLVHG